MRLFSLDNARFILGTLDFVIISAGLLLFISEVTKNYYEINPLKSWLGLGIAMAGVVAAGIF